MLIQTCVLNRVIRGMALNASSMLVWIYNSDGAYFLLEGKDELYWKELLFSNEKMNLVMLSYSVTCTKCWEKFKNSVLFHQENASTYKFLLSMAALYDCGFELVDPLLPFLSQFGPVSLSFLPPKLKKKHLARGQYHTDDGVTPFINGFFDQHSPSFFTIGNPTLQ